MSPKCCMQVYFVGSEAKIDMRPSSVWLREKTAKWPWKTHLRVGAKRDEALEILSSEGTLLVLCSLVDNMPYVVAEAAVRSIAWHDIPLVVWRSGAKVSDVGLAMPHSSEDSVQLAVEFVVR